MKQYELFDRREPSNLGLIVIGLAILWIATLAIVVYLLLQAKTLDSQHWAGTQQPSFIKGTDEKPTATTGESTGRFQLSVPRKHLSGSSNDPESVDE